MNELEDERVVSDGLAGQLIRAGRAERAGAGARAVATELSSLVGSASMVGSGSRLLTATKWIVVSLLVSSGGAALRWSMHEHGVGNSTPAAAAARTVTPREQITLATTAPAPAIGASASTSGDAVLVPPVAAERQSRSRTVAPLALPSALRAQETPAAHDARLRQELEALRAARAALAQQAPGRALALLDAKVGGFGLLPIEASLVRIEARRALGDERGARQLAESLFAEHGAGPYADRLRILAGRRSP